MKLSSERCQDLADIKRIIKQTINYLKTYLIRTEIPIMQIKKTSFLKLTEYCLKFILCMLMQTCSVLPKSTSSSASKKVLTRKLKPDDTNFYNWKILHSCYIIRNIFYCIHYLFKIYEYQLYYFVTLCDNNVNITNLAGRQK